jgi:hypothetical protein
MGACNVCRNGGQITNPDLGFTMVDAANNVSVDWTCGWLEESVADVNPAGAQGEAFMCGLAQLWAELECSCNGPPITPLSANVIDLNPACDLCAGSPLDYVPALLSQELVETGVAGRMPCGGLYSALSLGVVSASLCPKVRGYAGSFCCSVPAVDTTQLQDFNNNTVSTANNTLGNNTLENNTLGNNTPGNNIVLNSTLANSTLAEDPEGEESPGNSTTACASIQSSCGESQDCCSGYQCVTLVIGDDPICSPQASPIPKESVACGNHGGAGGASNCAP